MMDMVDAAAAGSFYVGIKPSRLTRTTPHPTTLLLFHMPQSLSRPKALKASNLNSVTAADSSSQSKGRTVGGQLQPYNKSDVVCQSSSRRREEEEEEILEKSSSTIKIKKKRRVFLLDVNSLCYKGENPSLHTFAHWISLFFSQISLNDPVIAVSTLPSYSPHSLSLLYAYCAQYDTL